MSERYETLKRRALRGRTQTEAIAWLDERYTGSTRAAMRHQMTATPAQTVAEMRLRRDLVQAAA